jgi:hypothetical protein
MMLLLDKRSIFRAYYILFLDTLAAVVGPPADGAMQDFWNPLATIGGCIRRLRKENARGRPRNSRRAPNKAMETPLKLPMQNRQRQRRRRRRQQQQPLPLIHLRHRLPCYNT